MKSMQKLALFSSWLRKHAELVGSIAFTGVNMERASTEAGAAYCDAAEQLLALSLQEAAAAEPAARMRSALQLHSCSITCVRSPALLLALPPSLCHQLLLQHNSSWSSGLCLESSSITAAVVRLSQLRSLTLHGDVGNACLAAVGQLAHLTQLIVGTFYGRGDSGCDLRLLPQQLQSMVATVSSGFGSAAAVALGHVTALKDLDITFQGCSAAPGSSLPTSLTALSAWLEQEDETTNSGQYLGLTALQHLQRLQSCGLEQAELLKQLSTLAALTSVELNYVDAWSAQRAAPGWQHLSMLRSLVIDQDDDEDTAQLDGAQGAVLLQGLAAASSLTTLIIEGPIVPGGLQLCEHLTALARLQRLTIHNAGVASRTDALYLAALTSLTRLNLQGAVGVDDVAASVLALRLTRLQDLRLECCGLRSAVALPSIAGLTGLTHLDLSFSDAYDAASNGTVSMLPLGQDDLLLLTPLRGLKQLGNRGFFCSAAACRLWCLHRGWLQPPPAWLCQV
jgi:hypothetical protein